MAHETKTAAKVGRGLMMCTNRGIVTESMFEIMADAYLRQHGIGFMPALPYINHVAKYFELAADQMEWGRAVIKRALAKIMVDGSVHPYRGAMPPASRPSSYAGR